MATRPNFDAELEQMSNDLILMGAMASDATDRAILALESGDNELAQEVINGDKDVDDMERKIEHQCLTLLLRQQPVAGDLRKISTTIKMITDIERVGDAAADIAEIATTLPPGIPPHLSKLKDMAAAARGMVSDAIKAYVEEDLELADEVIKRDDIVDDYFNQIKHKIGGLIANDPSSIDIALEYLMINKYLERLGDHATNIAEWVLFYKTGEHQNR